MSNAFTRSWEITKITFKVIRADKELILFPIVGGIFSFLFVLALLLPTIISLVIGEAFSMSLFFYASLFIIYFGLAFIATFFNTCIVYTTKKRFAGGNATFAESIRFAISKINLIVAWSVVSATVGIILRILDNIAEKSGAVGRIIFAILNSILGLLWSIVSIFVVPAMVYHDLGPFDSIKKSVQTLKKTWGESLIRYYGLGIVEAVFIVLGIVFFGSLTLLMVITGAFANAAGLGVLLVIVLLAIMYISLVVIFFNVATMVFNTALYQYADQGKLPMGYSKTIMDNAFKSKKKGLF